MPLAGQTNPNHLRANWLLKVGVGLNRQSVSDKNFTTLLYSGQSVGYSGGLKYEADNSFHELEVFYTTGTRTIKAFPEKRLRSGYFNLDYANLYRIGILENQSLACKIGGAMNVLYAKRQFNNFINNNAAFEFAASLSAALEGTYKFGNDPAGFSITNRLTVPFVSLVSQPSFGSNNAAGCVSQNDNAFGNILKGNRIVGFSSFLRFKNYFCIEKAITDNGKLSLNYTWDIYRLNGLRQVTQATHRLDFKYSFIF